VSNYYQKARELGYLLLSGEEAARVARAEAALTETPDSLAARAEYRQAKQAYNNLTKRVLAVISATIDDETPREPACPGCMGERFQIRTEYVFGSASPGGALEQKTCGGCHAQLHPHDGAIFRH
jgi:hypothetical protein